MSDCPFCARIAAGDYDDEYDGIVHFRPLNPVTPGHMLVVPKAHVIDALENPHVAGQAMAYAANLAQQSCNLITSAGAVATQTVFHLHIHIVPRREGDGLALPWTGQKRREEASDE
jgi:histidine triad (HIT) family protein